MNMKKLISRLEESVLSEADSTLTLSRIAELDARRKGNFRKASNKFTIEKNGKNFLPYSEHGGSPSVPLSDSEVKSFAKSIVKKGFYDKKMTAADLRDNYELSAPSWVGSISYFVPYGAMSASDRKKLFIGRDGFNLSPDKKLTLEFQKFLDGRYGKDQFVCFAQNSEEVVDISPYGNRSQWRDPEHYMVVIDVWFGHKFLKNFVDEVDKIVKANPESVIEDTIDEITDVLDGIPLKQKKLDFSMMGKEPHWSYDHRDRTRLDHYVGDGWDDRRDDDDDDQGWDEDAWNTDYAYPTQQKVSDWLGKNIGKGLFYVEIGEKGHVDVSLTDAGLKKYGLK
jgi:hypothetical protein